MITACQEKKVRGRKPHLLRIYYELSNLITSSHSVPKWFLEGSTSPQKPYCLLEVGPMAKLICEGMILNSILWNLCSAHSIPLPCIKVQTDLQEFQGYFAKRQHPACEFSTCLSEHFYVPGTVRGILYLWSHQVFSTNLWNKGCYYTHFHMRTLWLRAIK